MLFSFRIEGLFHLYTYDIDFRNADDSTVKFITAPNGYGKTTILDIINAVMNQSFESLIQIPFGSLSLSFSGDGLGRHYCLSVSKTETLGSEHDTDIVQVSESRLDINLYAISGTEESCIEHFRVLQNGDGGVVIDGQTNNLQMFLGSRTCFYLADNRMLFSKMDAAEQAMQIEEYPLLKYPKELKSILESPAKRTDYEERVVLFKSIINRCDFSNKHLEVDERYGFRFVADDELHSILSLDQLSSGEKQTVIQVFELLFHAQSGTLVLIDEPELSLHLMWQMNYLKTLTEIADLRSFQCIVATHSPQVFNSLWSKSVDLFELSKRNANE